jgi:hypothetical protein
LADGQIGRKFRSIRERFSTIVVISAFVEQICGLCDVVGEICSIAAGVQLRADDIGHVGMLGVVSLDVLQFRFEFE